MMILLHTKTASANTKSGANITRTDGCSMEIKLLNRIPLDTTSKRLLTVTFSRKSARENSRKSESHAEGDQRKEKEC